MVIILTVVETLLSFLFIVWQHTVKRQILDRQEQRAPVWRQRDAWTYQRHNRLHHQNGGVAGQVSVSVCVRKEARKCGGIVVEGRSVLGCGRRYREVLSSNGAVIRNT